MKELTSCCDSTASPPELGHSTGKYAAQLRGNDVASSRAVVCRCSTAITTTTSATRRAAGIATAPAPVCSARNGRGKA